MGKKKLKKKVNRLEEELDDLRDYVLVSFRKLQAEMEKELVEIPCSTDSITIGDVEKMWNEAKAVKVFHEEHPTNIFDALARYYETNWSPIVSWEPKDNGIYTYTFTFPSRFQWKKEDKNGRDSQGTS